MIIRAVRFGERPTSAKAAWITLGSDYVVLELVIQPSSGRIDARVITDEGGRVEGLFALADFEITDRRLSETWRFTHEEDLITIGLEAFGGSFWENFYDDNPHPRLLSDRHADRMTAVQRFDEVVADLHAEAGRIWVNAPPVSSDIPQP